MSTGAPAADGPAGVHWVLAWRGAVSAAIPRQMSTGRASCRRAAGVSGRGWRRSCTRRNGRAPAGVAGDDLRADRHHAVSSGERAPMSRPIGAQDTVEVGAGDARLGQALQALGVGLPGAHHADVTDAGAEQAAGDGRHVELGIVGQDARTTSRGPRDGPRSEKMGPGQPTTISSAMGNRRLVAKISGRRTPPLGSRGSWPPSPVRP